MSIAKEYLREDSEAEEKDIIEPSLGIIQEPGEDLPEDIDLDDGFSSLIEEQASEQEDGLSENIDDDDSEMAMLQALYSDTEEVTDAESEAEADAEETHDNVSLLQEIDRQYPDSANEDVADEGLTAEESDAVSAYDVEGDENQESDDDILQELVDLSLIDPATTDMNMSDDESKGDEKESSEDSDVGGMSALEELKAFLEEAGISDDDTDSEQTPQGNDEYFVENHDSILEQLQNLLQACIEELRASADNDSSTSALSARAEYPGFQELKTLLESTLSQLMQLSSESVDSDLLSENTSVLDELSVMLDQIDSGSSDNHTDDPVSHDEVDEYLSSITEEVENPDNATAAADSVLVEMQELLGDSASIAKEFSDVITDDEAAVPDDGSEYDVMQSADVEAPEMLASTDMTAEDGEAGSRESSVLDEYRDYLQDSTDSVSITDENQEMDTEAEDTLAQLEAMLGESGSNMDEISAASQEQDEVEQYADDEVQMEAASKVSAETEDNLSIEVQSVQDEVNRQDEAQTSYADAAGAKRFPVAGLSILAAAVIGVIVYWNMSADREPGQQVTVKQRASARPAVVNLPANKRIKPFVPQAETEVIARKENNTMTRVTAEAENNRETLSAAVEDTSGALESRYEYNEVKYDISSETAAYDEPEVYVDQVKAAENIDITRQHEDALVAASAITEDRIIQLIAQQIEQMRLETAGSLALLEEEVVLLNERLSVAESSIVDLRLVVDEMRQHPPVIMEPSNTSVTDAELMIRQVQDESERNFGQINARVEEAESSISELQLALEQYKQAASAQSVSDLTDKENALQLNERMSVAESSIVDLRHAIEGVKQLAPVVTKYTASSSADTEHKIRRVQDESERNFGQINARVEEAESSISELQLAVEKYQQLGPIQSVSSIAEKMNAERRSNPSAAAMKEQTYKIWSVHLLSYYGKPPPAGELDFLDEAGVPYLIRKANVKGGIWYRVLVNNSTEYSAAKDYAEMLKQRLGIKGIWISSKKYSYEL